MKIVKFAVVVALIVLVAVPALHAQRRNQLEVYGGAAFPLQPDTFKDFFKVGLSINVQYVLFPTPNLGIPVFVGFEGFTVDNEAISNTFGRQFIVGAPIFDNAGNEIGTATGGSLDTEGKANITKVGLGLRPYITPLESPTQIFLFGSAVFNVIRSEEQINGGTITWEDFSGNTNSFEMSDDDIDFLFGGREFKTEDEKFGVAAGGGIEIPAGPTWNLIFQGLFNIIFTEDESTTFVGVTAGVVF